MSANVFQALFTDSPQDVMNVIGQLAWTGLESLIVGASVLISQRSPEDNSLLTAFSNPMKDMGLSSKSRQDPGGRPLTLTLEP